ncbi:MAG: site-specific integrase [Nitrococcus sp.]|nr:site-specific integrase [Nitrococcus sp.]
METTALPSPPGNAVLPIRAGTPLPGIATGGTGPMRADTEPLIEADTDLEAVCQWLTLRVLGKSPHTFESYWLNTERLLLWAAIERGKCLSQLMPADYVAYVKFLTDPQPRERWVGARAPRGSPQWRAFAGPLKASSRETALRSIGSLLGFLHEAGYFRANPLKLADLQLARSKAAAPVLERYLDLDLWHHTCAHVEAWPRRNAHEIAHFERARWLLTLLYGLDLRRAEACGHTQSIFHQVQRPSGSQWWAALTGKGGKSRTIPVPAAVIEALARYRAHKGLPPYPAGEDTAPLICRVNGTRAITAKMLYVLVKGIFAGAAEELEVSNTHGAAHLRRASTHWLRHTGITHKGDYAGISLKLRGRSAGHSRLQTTQGYDHAPRDHWYAELQRVELPWKR